MIFLHPFEPNLVTQFSKCNNVFSFQNLSSMTITVINTPIEVSFATPSEIVTFLKKILIMTIMMIGKKDLGKKGKKD